MRKIEGRGLWIGNVGDLRVPTAIIDAGIEAIVELADGEPMAILPRGLVRCRFPLSDGGDNAIAVLRLAAESVAGLLRERIPTLVCCSAGMSRSICVAAGGISIAEGRPLMDAVTLVVDSGPADISPLLLAQTRQAMMSSETR
ncbi:MAG TPA: hypothetical protein VHR72_05065 [Gemmataceae bacterium]|jgi:hypothetical protein|nr:hypothetical protein [Gemmataceae bacterium]